MHRRRLTRALIALAVPALIVPALAAPATAAAKPGVPTIEQVAKIWPHLAGGSADVSTSKVYGLGKKCKQGKAIKGASARSASYSPDYSSGNPDVFEITGKTPALSVTAMRFPSPKAAIAYLRSFDKSAKDCVSGGGGGGGPKCKVSTKKIAFKLGDERSGQQYKMTCKEGSRKHRSVFNWLFVRDGKHLVYTSAMSLDASAPSIPKTVKLAKLAVKTAG